jgi:hypothetical protein
MFLNQLIVEIFQFAVILREEQYFIYVSYHFSMICKFNIQRVSNRFILILPVSYSVIVYCEAF